MAKRETEEMIQVRRRKFWSLTMPLAAVSAVGKWSDRDRVLLSSSRGYSTREVSFMRLKIAAVKGDGCLPRYAICTCTSAVRFGQSRHDVGRSV